MKKIFLSLLLSGFTYSILPAQLSCGTYDDFDSKFNQVGAFHNSSMSHIKSNFEALGSVTTRAAAIDYLKEFNKAYFTQHVDEYFPNPLPPIQIDNLFESTKGYVDNITFQRGLFVRGSGWCLDDIKDQIAGSNLVDQANKEIFQDLVDVVKDASEFSSPQVENRLVSIANNWLATNEGKSENGKDITGHVISIGLKSCEWWRQNPDATGFFKLLNKSNAKLDSGPFYEEEFEDIQVLVFPWLADLAGALLSAGMYTLTSGPNFNWEKLGQSALGGGISSSAGLGAKVLKWIKDLF